MSDRAAETSYSSGKTLYRVRFNPDGTVWNKDALQWQTYDAANWAHYAVPFTEYAGSGYYRSATLIDALDVVTTDVVYQQAGMAPDQSADMPPLTIGQPQGADVAALDGSIASAARLSTSAKSIAPGTVQAGSNTTTQVVTDFTPSTNNLYRGRVVIFTSGAAAGCAGIVTDYVGTSKILKFTTLAAAPSPGDEFAVV